MARRVTAEVLSDVLESPSAAYDAVDQALPRLAQCGPLSLLAGPALDVREKLVDMTELVAALLDAQRHEGD
ncbi:MAG: hypothetical protein IRZ10_06375 [Thermoflavifilum sp.]|nr:hypothetical protein [Thermoflavifilum sp.]MCL6514031.1 hypothetical protein [Alicyclobacillus sp.]